MRARSISDKAPKDRLLLAEGGPAAKPRARDIVDQDDAELHQQHAERHDEAEIERAISQRAAGLFRYRVRL